MSVSATDVLQPQPSAASSPSHAAIAYIQAQTPTQPLGLQSWQLEIARTGVSLHYVTSRPPAAVKGTLVLVHGWPDCWFTWRRQVAALTVAGWRCVMIDQRGYGESIVIDEKARRHTDSYSLQLACKDIELLCRAEGVSEKSGGVVVVGHDWGGATVWSFARRYPSLCAGVVAICTPYRPKKSSYVSPEAMAAIYPAFHYQVYFSRDRAKAVREFEANPQRLFKAMYRSGVKGDGGGYKLMTAQSAGFLSNGPAEIPISPMISQRELDLQQQLMAPAGFDSGLMWYSTSFINWLENDFHVADESFDVRRAGWNRPPSKEAPRTDVAVLSQRVEQAALMITAANDPVLSPGMTVGMEQWMPRLSRLHVEQASHWAQQDQPKQVNEGLLKFLEGLKKQAKL